MQGRMHNFLQTVSHLKKEQIASLLITYFLHSKKIKMRVILLVIRNFRLYPAQPSFFSEQNKLQNFPEHSY